MSRPDLLPHVVETVVAEFRRRVDAERAPALRGLYLVGSVALDDFRPGASDIDVIAVVDAKPSTEACEDLARVHAGLAEAGGPCLDGPYLVAEALRQVPTDYAVVPFSLEGRFRHGEVCREVNPVVWRCLARHGRTVLGPPPAELGIADDDAVLRAYQVDNLRGYWLSWIAQAEAACAAKAPGEDASAAALAWGVLGVARIVCALDTDAVVSKSGGGRYALSAHSDRWHPVIREALAAHGGATTRVQVETVREGLGYMRSVIAAATDPHAAARERQPP
ncbi:aminoglycoside adenylyltransferase domain-containing protein [Methylobacterium phyllosphaerae]